MSGFEAAADDRRTRNGGGVAVDVRSGEVNVAGRSSFGVCGEKDTAFEDERRGVVGFDVAPEEAFERVELEEFVYGSACGAGSGLEIEVRGARCRVSAWRGFIEGSRLLCEVPAWHGGMTWLGRGARRDDCRVG